MFQTMLNDHIKFMMSVIVVVVVVMQGSIVSAFKKIPMLTGNDSIDGMSFKLQRIHSLIKCSYLTDCVII